MKKTILATTLLLSMNAYSIENSLIQKVKEVDSTPLSEMNVSGKYSYSLIVKFNDNNISQSLFYVPEKKELQEQIFLNQDYSTAQANNLKVSNREKGFEYLAQIYNETGYMLKQVRTLSMGYNKFNIQTNDIEQAIETLENTGLFKSIEVDQEVELKNVELRPLSERNMKTIVSPNGFNYGKYTDTYISGQDYLDIQQEYSMGSHGFFEAQEYAKSNNKLNRKVRVAVLDSGYLKNYDQEEFVEGVDMTSFSYLKDCKSADNENYSGSDVTCPIEDLIDKERDNDPVDKAWLIEQDSEGNEQGKLYISGHGLSVASIIASKNNNGNGIYGAAGADLVDIVHVKVLNSLKSGYGSDIVDGIIWAAGGEVPGLENISEKVDIINMSLGGATSCDNYQIMNEAIDFARSQDVVVIVAAGNDSMDVKDFQPAGCEGVLTVGANNSFGEISTFSNYGEKVDVSFKGEDIYVASLNEFTYKNPQTNSSCKNPDTNEVDAKNCFSSGAGTSFAAPLASAAVALMKIVNPDLTESELRATISTTAGNYDRNEYGEETLLSDLSPYAGIGNVEKAIVSNYDKYTVNNLNISHRYKGFEREFDKKYLDKLVESNDNKKSTVCSLYELNWGDFRESVSGVNYTIYGANGLSSNEAMTTTNSDVILEGIDNKNILINISDYQKIGIQALTGDIYEFDISSAELPSYCL